jgi:hypothetical protein
LIAACESAHVKLGVFFQDRDQCVRALGGYIDGLFNQHMKALSRRGYPVFGMQARRRADENGVHRPVAEECVEVFIDSRSGAIRQPPGLVGILPVDGGYFHAIDIECGAHVGLTYVAASQNSYV